MATYIITFALSLIFMYWATKKNSKFFSIVLHILAIIPPVFLLTFRAVECGTDTINYLYLFNAIGNVPLLNYIASTRLEPLFAVLMYVVNQTHLSIEYLFFASALLTIVPVYYGAILLRKNVNPIYVMALYYLMFYHHSFNIVRQMIAMSIMFLAVVYLINDRKRFSFVLGFIASMFHVVAMTFFVMYMYYNFRSRNKFWTIFLSTISLGVMMYLFQSLFTIKVESIQSHIDSGEGSLQLSYFLEMSLNLLIVLFVWRKGDKNLKQFFIFVSALTLIVILLSPMAPYFFRIALNIDIAILAYIPLSLKSSHSTMLNISYMSFAIFFWLYFFIIHGTGRSYPYILSPSFSLFS